MINTARHNYTSKEINLNMFVINNNRQSVFEMSFFMSIASNILF